MGASFFSYSRIDQDFALKLADDLRKNEIEIWFDQIDIPKGSLWDVEIEKALKNCDTLIVVISTNSVKSNNVLDEISYAVEENKRIIPVKISSCEIPFRIRRLQYIEFTKNYQVGLTALLKCFNNTELPSPTYKVQKEEIIIRKRWYQTSNKWRWLLTPLLIIFAITIYKFTFQDSSTLISSLPLNDSLNPKVIDSNIAFKKDTIKVIKPNENFGINKINKEKEKVIPETDKTKIYDYYSYGEMGGQTDAIIENYKNEFGGSPDVTDVIFKKLKEQGINWENHTCKITFKFFWTIDENGNVSNVTYRNDPSNCSKQEINLLTSSITSIIKSLKYKPLTLKGKPIKYKEDDILPFYD